MAQAFSIWSSTLALHGVSLCPASAILSACGLVLPFGADPSWIQRITSLTKLFPVSVRHVLLVIFCVVGSQLWVLRPRLGVALVCATTEAAGVSEVFTRSGFHPVLFLPTPRQTVSTRHAEQRHQKHHRRLGCA